MRNFGRMRIDRLRGALERRQGVVRVGRSVTVTILFVVEFGVTVGVPMVVGVAASSDSRERDGHAIVHIRVSVFFRGSTEVKDEPGDCYAD